MAAPVMGSRQPFNEAQPLSAAGLSFESMTLSLIADNEAGLRRDEVQAA
jgi:hypothetical protein